MIKREVIGVPECPLIYRWTLLDFGKKVGKVMVHYFLPTQRDRDPHDHPRSFVTLVLRGGYDDIQPNGTVDQVRGPAIRFRPAAHAHITVAGKRGAWTVVIMGPLERDWGFIREGLWWPWRRYEDKFGLNFRCDSDD